MAPSPKPTASRSANSHGGDCDELVWCMLRLYDLLALLPRNVLWSLEMANKNTLKDLLTDEIKDLYSAEKQLTKAIPKMARGASDPILKEAFKAHLEETKGQVTRLEEIGQILGIKVTGKKCAGMEGVIQEGAEALEEEGEAPILDLGIIGAGSRVEHYEMAGYLTAISLAKRIGAVDVVNLLRQTLAEEEAAEKKLRQIASTILKATPIQSAA